MANARVKTHVYKLKPSVLAIVPPYSYSVPPLGIAALLAYLKSQGCFDFDFVDMRLFTSSVAAPTYRPQGAFGETYVLDVPDLPLVLDLIQCHDRRRRYEPKVDATLSSYTLARAMNPVVLVRYLRQMQTFLEIICARLVDARFVGFSVWNSNYLTTLMAASLLKRRPQAPFIVLGGPQVTESSNSAQLALKSGLADVVALGEGEQTLYEIYSAFSKHRTTRDVPGTTVFDPASGGFVTRRRPLMKMSERPLPDFSDMHIAAYQKHAYSGMTMLPFELSRGCTDRCSFCSEWVFWEKYRPAPIAHALDQLRELRARYDARGFWFADSLLNGSRSRLHAFCSGLLESSLDVTWLGFFRANVDAATAELVKRAGCDIAFLGVESFSDETLERMNKRMTRAQNLSGLANLLEAGLSRVIAGVIPGFPGDTRERFLATALELTHLQSRYPARMRCNVEPFVVSPGQPIFHAPAAHGLTPTKWPSSVTELAPCVADIAGEIWETVSGSNQGLERLGAFAIANAINRSNQVAIRGFRDPYFYDGTEDLLSDELDLVHLSGMWHLARFKSPSGTRCGVIVSEVELREHRDAMLQARLRGDVATTFAVLTARIAARQLTCPSEDGPWVEACGSPPPSFEDQFALSPFIAIREAQDVECLVVADVHCARWQFVRSALASELLRMRYRWCGESAVVGSGNNTSAVMDRMTITELVENGFVMQRRARASVQSSRTYRSLPVISQDE